VLGPPSPFAISFHIHTPREARLLVPQRRVHGAAHFNSNLRAGFFVIVLRVHQLGGVIRQAFLHRLGVELRLGRKRVRRES
jgi:hypothetical protein